MVSRLLIGDNNLAKFWPAFQFGRAGFKSSSLLTATDLDTLDLALSQVEEKDVVIVSILTSVLLEEVNHLELDSSAYNVCDQVVTRISGLCPRSPSYQVVCSFRVDLWFFVFGNFNADFGFVMSFSWLFSNSSFSLPRLRNAFCLVGIRIRFRPSTRR